MRTRRVRQVAGLVMLLAAFDLTGLTAIIAGAGGLYVGLHGDRRIERLRLLDLSDSNHTATHTGGRGR